MSPEEKMAEELADKVTSKSLEITRSHLGLHTKAVVLAMFAPICGTAPGPCVTSRRDWRLWSY